MCTKYCALAVIIVLFRTNNYVSTILRVRLTFLAGIYAHFQLRDTCELYCGAFYRGRVLLLQTLIFLIIFEKI